MTEEKKVVKNFYHLVHEKAGALRGDERPHRGSAKTTGFAEGEASPYKKIAFPRPIFVYYSQHQKGWY